MTPRVADVRAEDERAARAQRGRHAEPHTVTRLVWDGCRKNGAVEHLRLTGAGHGWPGVETPGLRRRIIGEGTTLFHASDEAWAFLSRFVR